MAEITLVLGGTRSGKSEIAERIAAEAAARQKREVVYLATCRPGDNELLERVRKHRERRPAHWTTIEETHDPARAIGDLKQPAATTILECLSFLIFNWMEEGARDEEIASRLDRLIATMHATGHAFIVVSNDVSGALIPPDPSTRRYQDLVGRANQQMAAAADRVILAVAGLPLTLKGL
jgi:adenosylcobinamide kinase / adenosylcobinamide-phosphate guanylyltransferase